MLLMASEGGQTEQMCTCACMLFLAVIEVQLSCKKQKKRADQPEGFLVCTSLRARREPVVLSWLVYRKLNCYQCKPPNDNVWAKAVGSHVCRHGEVQEKPKAGQSETMAGQQGGGSMSGIWSQTICGSCILAWG